jgi:hypothetical protein
MAVQKQALGLNRQNMLGMLKALSMALVRYTLCGLEMPECGGRIAGGPYESRPVLGIRSANPEYHANHEKLGRFPRCE